MGDISDKFVVGANFKAEDIKKNDELTKTEDDSSIEESVAEDIKKNDELTKTEDDSSVGESVKKHYGPNDYVQDLRGLIEAEVQNIFNEEIKKAKQELITEHRKVITQITEEQKSIIRELVKEEKNAIWDKAAELKKSLLLHLSEELNNNNT